MKAAEENLTGNFELFSRKLYIYNPIELLVFSITIIQIWLELIQQWREGIISWVASDIHHTQSL